MPCMANLGTACKEALLSPAKAVYEMFQSDVFMQSDGHLLDCPFVIGSVVVDGEQDRTQSCLRALQNNDMSNDVRMHARR